MADTEKKAQQEATAEKKAKKHPQKQTPKIRRQGQKDAEKKQNIFARIAGWFKDLKKEFKKVVWPDRKKVFNNTLVVLCVVVIGSVVVGLLDSGFVHLMKFLIGLSK
ncbi:MAG: preprotein translocase subunit SecE [Ruminococcus sp.]